MLEDKACNHQIQDPRNKEKIRTFREYGCYDYCEVYNRMNYI